MDLWVLDSKFENLGIIDAYKSLVWSERFRLCGDFILDIPATKEYMDLLKVDLYLASQDFKSVMVIEGREVTTHVEDGKFMQVSGRSLESILDRRVVWDKISWGGGYLQDLVERILNENVINPSDSSRKIEGFTFKKSTNSAITEIEEDELELHGDGVYDAITILCAAHDIGFRVSPSGSGGFEFELYAGVDRSYDQDIRPWIVFSPEYDNLMNTRSAETKKNYKNYALVLGGENRTSGIEYVTSATIDSSAYGMDRREGCVETSASRYDDDGNAVPESTYLAQIKTKAENALLDTRVTKIFDGEANANIQFEYGTDFDMGDQVQVINEFGDEDVVRIIEVVTSDDSRGIIVTPSFEFTETGG